MGRRLAILIGNQSFAEGSGFAPLRGPLNDVAAMARVLGDPARGGFQPATVLRDRTRLDIMRMIRTSLHDATDQDEVLIHYSGHGKPDDKGRLHFAASDSRADELPESAVRARDLQEWAIASRARSIILLLDCCYAGAYGEALNAGLKGNVADTIAQQLRATVGDARGLFILTSSTGWQTSQEVEDARDGVVMGRFTRALVERLAAPGAGGPGGGGPGGGGVVRLSHLAAHVQGLFGQDARKFEADAQGDPLILLAPQTPPKARAHEVLAEWWDRGLLTDAELAAMGGFVDGEAAAAARLIGLLNVPDVVPASVLPAWRRMVAAKPDAAPPEGGNGPPKIVAPPAWTGRVLRPMAPKPGKAKPSVAGGDAVAPKAASPVPAWGGRVLRPMPGGPAAMLVNRILQSHRALPDAASPGAAFQRWREEPQPWCPELILLPPGAFIMGAPASEELSLDDERPRREVTIGWPFALGRCAVTFAEWDAAIRAGASLPRLADAGWGRGASPVIHVGWLEAGAYCAWLNKALGLAAGTYRLPSEAEWEYACRAGTTTPFSTGETIGTEQANYDGNDAYSGAKGTYRQRTVEVGSLPANRWGLHEMHGNVWEWVEDAYGPYPDRPTDAAPLKQPDAACRVIRGGSWDNQLRNIRSARRFELAPDRPYNGLGFRVARTLF